MEALQAVGNGTTDDTAAINSWLAVSSRHLYAPAGVYRFTAPLRLYDKTKIECHPDAVFLNDNPDGKGFVNGPVGDASFATGYTGPGNIHVIGGRMEFTARAPGSSHTIAFTFAHAHNVSLSGFVASGGFSGHYVELNATRFARFRDCDFSDQIINTGDTGRDAINIDFSYQTGIPYMGAWDGTTCDDVVVDSCRFTNVQIGVGSHSLTGPASKVKNIRVQNSLFENIGQHAILARYWDAPSIIENTIRSTDDKALYIYACDGASVTGNVIRDATNGDTHAMQLQNSTNSYVRGNSIKNIGTNYLYAIRSFGGSGNMVFTSGAAAGASGLTHVQDGSVAA